MVSSSPRSQNLTLYILLEKTEDGRSRATMLGLPDCVIEAPTDEEAIAQLRVIVMDRIIRSQIIPMEIAFFQRIESENL